MTALFHMSFVNFCVQRTSTGLKVKNDNKKAQSSFKFYFSMVYIHSECVDFFFNPESQEIKTLIHLFVCSAGYFTQSTKHDHKE